MIEKDAKQVYQVPWEKIEDKNAFNDIDKYGFYPHPTENGVGNEDAHVDIVIFRPISAVPEDNPISKKLIEILSDEEVYQYFKNSLLIDDLKKHGVRYKGSGKGNHRPFMWKGGKRFLSQTWYACIDYRENPTILTIRSMLLPFFEFGNVDVIDSVLPEAKEWLKEGKLKIEDASIVKERILRDEKAKREKDDHAERDIREA